MKVNAKNLLGVLAAVYLVTTTAAVQSQECNGGEDPSPVVTIETTEGDITLCLFHHKAPITVANFLKYVESGHYEGSIFHRVINGFMIQTGGFDQRYEPLPSESPIENEAKKSKLHNVRGTIAMARTDDPDSATDQFFINHRNNLRLDWAPGKAGYAVFGKVQDKLSMSTVDYIATVPIKNRGGAFSDSPSMPIVINKVTWTNKP